VKTLVDNQEIKGYRRSLAEATLGHVYVAPGEGRVPVYALGSPGPNADNSCYHQRWGASRVKRYVTAEQERTQLLAQRWRDDGIVFYVPAPDAEGTKPVYTVTDGDAVGSDAATLYFVDGPEADARQNSSVAFSVLAEQELPHTVPLMRVFYSNGCGNEHDELTPGLPHFERARSQGDKQPMFELHWSGITEPTTLVVEALDQGCPFPGILAPISRPASRDDNVPYPAFLTLADAQAASSTGEVFINGQHEETNRPRPIARSFVRVAPGPKPNFDWFAGFGPDEDIPDFMAGSWEEPCENPENPNCLREYRQRSDFADVTFTSATPNRNGIAPVLGELWVTYADVGADVGGKFRLTPITKGRMSAEAYLHVSMEVDAYTTTRRYPQMFISDAAAPVQWRFSESNTIVVQTFPDTGTTNWPYLYQLEVCNHRAWDVNNQCPMVDLYRLRDAAGETTGMLAPVPELSEHSGVDRSTRFDVFVSTRRAYLFLDTKPYGCVDLPSSGIPSGDVTVTFGDVIYHSGVDDVQTFHKTRQQIVGKRHFDNLGFKSGVEGPAWDEARIPCFSATAIK
jgi:hypothetical protein